MTCSCRRFGEIGNQRCCASSAAKRCSSSSSRRDSSRGAGHGEVNLVPGVAAGTGVEPDGRRGDVAVLAREQLEPRRVVFQRDAGRKHHPLDGRRAFAKRLNSAFAFDSDSVRVDGVVERRDGDTTRARQRDSWCLTMRATPLQNRQVIPSSAACRADDRAAIRQRRHRAAPARASASWSCDKSHTATAAGRARTCSSRHDAGRHDRPRPRAQPAHGRRRICKEAAQVAAAAGAAAKSHRCKSDARPRARTVRAGDR